MKKPCIYFWNIFHASSWQWKTKNNQKPPTNKQTTHKLEKKPQQNKHLLNDSPSHGTITYGSVLLQPQANNISH